jgi:Restriction endonuclease S subunits
LLATPKLQFKEVTANFTDWTDFILSDLAIEIQGGGTPSRDVTEFWNGDISWVTIKDLISSNFNETQEYITSAGVENSATNIVPAGTLIVATRINVGKCKIYNVDVAINQDLKAIFFKQEVSTLFMQYWFEKNFQKIQNYGSGSTVMGIQLETLRNFVVWLPKKSEQEKIANFLSAIDTLIRLQRRKVELLKDYFIGVIVTIFSNVENEGEYCKFSDCFVKGKAGGTPKTTVREYYNGDIPFMSISDMTRQGKYITYTKKVISKDGLCNSSAWLVPEGSLILSMYASVGFTSINKIPLTTSQAMFSMTFNDILLRDYIHYYFCFYRRRKMSSYIERGTQGNINADFIRGIDIPMVKNEEIQVFVNMLSTLDELIFKEEKKVAQLESFKSGLIAQMFV